MQKNPIPTDNGLQRVFAETARVISAIAVLAAMGFPVAPFPGVRSVLAQAQDRPESQMEQRQKQLLDALERAEDCPTAKAILDLVPGTLDANMWVLPGKDAPEVTTKAFQAMRDMAARVAGGLANFVQKGKCPEERGRALDLRLLVEERIEVADAVGTVTQKLGQGDKSDDLMAHLDEETGREVYGPPPPGQPPPTGVIIKPGFSVKLRGPFVPPYVRQVQEDVRLTTPIGPGQCTVVFKETKGLMLRLIFVRMDVVLDPWATPVLARGTRIPVWALQWVPSEYVKEWNICNVGGKIQKTVTQRVVQDVPLNYFWRYYPKDP